MDQFHILCFNAAYLFFQLWEFNVSQEGGLVGGDGRMRGGRGNKMRKEQIKNIYGTWM